MKFGVRKLKSWGYVYVPDSEEIMPLAFFVLTQYRRVTDGQTDTLLSQRLDWIVQCFMSPPTQYRLYERRFLQVKRPNQQYQSTEGDATEDKAKNENN